MGDRVIKIIKLTQNKYAIVDDWNYGWLNQHKWCAVKDGNTYYAARNIKRNGKHTAERMHRSILGLVFGDGKITDHANHNGLDNRLCNIKAVTRRENANNRKASTKGAYLHKATKNGKTYIYWTAKIWVNNKLVHIGHFDNKEDAYKAYLDAKQKYHTIK